MSIEAMKQALEALEENHHLIEEHERPDYLALYDRRIHGLRTAIEEYEEIGDAYKKGWLECQAAWKLAMSNQEPVAWMHPKWPNYTGHTYPVTTYMVNGWTPLYTTTPAAPINSTTLMSSTSAAPMQEPDNSDELTIAYMSGLQRGKELAAQPAPVQEPVAVVSGYYGGQCVVLPTNPARLFNPGTALYVHANDTSQERVAETAKREHEWVELTEEEIDKLKHLIDWTATWSHGRFAYEIEQLLKEKNT